MKRTWRRLRAAVYLATRPGRRRPGVLVAGLIVLCGWQSVIAFRRPDLGPRYRIVAPSGVQFQKDFVFFLHHLGLFQLAPAGPPVNYGPDTRDNAERLLRERPQELVMDKLYTFRAGGQGAVFLYLPSVWLGASSFAPSLRPALTALWIAALATLFTGMWWVGRAGLGAAVVVLLGCDSAQLICLHSGSGYYNNENVFSIVITSAVFLLGLHVPWFARRRWSRWVWAVPVVTGLYMTLATTVRMEVNLLILSPIVVYVTMPGVSIRRRIALVAVLIGVTAGSSVAVQRRIENRMRSTEAALVAAGGHPYPVPFAGYHEFWHAVFCGLGDFGQKYGFAWDDGVAWAYAEPLLRARGVDVPPRPPGKPFYDPAYPGSSWDAARRYRRFPIELPGYPEVVRDRVVGTIVGDPLWYAGVLSRRALKLVTNLTPPVPGWLALFVFGLVVACRRSFQIKLLLFTLPLCAPALLIYSGGGMTYYAVYHLIAGGVAIAAVCAAGAARVSARRTAR